MGSNIMNNLRLSMNSFGSRREPFFIMVDYEMKHPVLYPLSSIPDNIRIEMPLFSNFVNTDHQIENVEIVKSPVSFDIYNRAFQIVKSNIKHGNSYLVNLTFPTEIKINLTLDEIFNVSRAMYKMLVENRFVLFSPEIFVRISDNKIRSYPMKGTIDASIPDAVNIIIEDEKELCEHNTIVDLIRNDLSIISNNVEVTRYRYIDRIETFDKTLLQVSSEITGDLTADWYDKLGDIIVPLLPAGSISGAPKRETLRIIRESEIEERGYYSGICGIFDGHSFDSAVMIRFIEQKGNRYVYRSGGGITFLSDPNKEYDELISKVYVPFG